MSTSTDRSGRKRPRSERLGIRKRVAQAFVRFATRKRKVALAPLPPASPLSLVAAFCRLRVLLGLSLISALQEVTDRASAPREFGVAHFFRIRAGFVRFRAIVVRLELSSGRIWPKWSQAWRNSCHVWSMSVEIRQITAQVSSTFADVGPKLSRTCADIGRIGPNLVDPWPILADSRQRVAGIGQFRAEFRRLRAEFSLIWKPVQLLSMLARFGRFVSSSCQDWVHLALIRNMSVDRFPLRFDKHCAFDRFRLDLGRARPAFHGSSHPSFRNAP